MCIRHIRNPCRCRIRMVVYNRAITRNCFRIISRGRVLARSRNRVIRRRGTISIASMAYHLFIHHSAYHNVSTNHCRRRCMRIIHFTILASSTRIKYMSYESY